jgi:hypothetical protein
MTSNEIQNITNQKPTDGSIRTPLKPVWNAGAPDIGRKEYGEL